MTSFSSEAIITKVETAPDGGYRIKVDLPEMSSDKAKALLDLKGGYISMTLTDGKE